MISKVSQEFDAERTIDSALAIDAVTDDFLLVSLDVSCAELVSQNRGTLPCHFAVQSGDEVVGVATALDVLLNPGACMKEVARSDPDLFVTMSTRLLEIARIFRKTSCRAVIVLDEDGQFAGLVTESTCNRGLANDVERLQGLLSAAQRAKKTRDEFLGHFNHAIRNPLTSILGCAELLEHQVLDAQCVEYVQTILRNGGELVSMLNDILDLSKIEAGRLELSRSPVRIGALAFDVYSQFRFKAEEKHVQLRIEIVSPLPEAVETDGERLHQILSNLLTNSITFTDEGSVTLRVGFNVRDRTADLRFDVLETGFGMSDEDLEKLFDPFAETHLSGSEQRGAIGLGLVNCRRLAELMGGAIEAKGCAGGGSMFSLILHPLKWSNSQPSSIHPTDSPTDSIDKNDHRLDEKRILLVDDQRDSLFVASKILEAAGATVDVAENGEVAIETVNRAVALGQPFDVIVMDMKMPVMDGYTTVRHLHEQGVHTPIIALTASATDDDRTACLDAGCANYLPKPIDTPLLVKLVDDLAGSHCCDVEHALMN